MPPVDPVPARWSKGEEISCKHKGTRKAECARKNIMVLTHQCTNMFLVRPSIQQGPFTDFCLSKHSRLLSHITRSNVSRTSKGENHEGRTNTYLKSKNTSILSEHFWKKAARHRPHSDRTALQEECHELDVIKYLTKQRIEPSVIHKTM